jgi:hypothetical protein
VNIFGPRRSFGSKYLWNVFVRNAAHNFIRNMIDAPILELDMSIGRPESQRMSATIEWLKRVSALPIYLAGADRPVNDGDIHRQNSPSSSQ